MREPPHEELEDSRLLHARAVIGVEHRELMEIGQQRRAAVRPAVRCIHSRWLTSPGPRRGRRQHELACVATQSDRLNTAPPAITLVTGRGAIRETTERMMQTVGQSGHVVSDRVRVFAPQSSASLASAIAQELGVALATSEEREFDGGEHKMRPLRDVRGCDVYVVHSLFGEVDASANDKLCRLLFFIGALRDAGAARVTACIPYLCYARKDRRTQPHDPVTTRYVAAMFEAAGV